MATGPKDSNAFVTARKGFCYLTIKCGRQNFDIMRIRSYTLDAEDKRRMRRLYTDVIFDWKKIATQLAEKREACRRYRSNRRKGTSDTSRHPNASEPFYAVYEPATRTVYANGSVSGVALLDAVLHIDRMLKSAPDQLETR